MSTTQECPFNIVQVATPIVPNPDENVLAPPFNDSVIYDSSSQVLEVSTTIMLPLGFDVKQVTLQVFCESSTATQLQFYFVYNQDGEATEFEAIPVTFQAPVPEVNGKAVPLSQFTETYMLVCDADPKTSRGTVTSVTPAPTTQSF